MSIRHITWLQKELPSLIEAGLITPEQSQSITEYYQGKIDKQPSLAIIFLAILGTLLLGGGVILIFAHNWEHFSRPLRALLSFMPLIIGQILGALYFIKNRGTGWAEGVSLFISLAVAAAIGLISQTYHIDGSLSGFLLTWMILSLPLVYLFRSVTVSLVYISGITSLLYVDVDWWSNYAKEFLLYWPLLAAFIPFWMTMYRKAKEGMALALVNWFLSISLICASFMALPELSHDFRIFIIAAVCAVLLLIEDLLFGAEHSGWHSPFRLFGKAGLLILYIIFSYLEVWKEIRGGFGGNIDYSSLSSLVSIGFWGVTLLLVILVWKKREKEVIMLSAGFPLALICYFLSIAGLGKVIITTLFNIYLLSLGIFYLRLGFTTIKARTTNMGVFLIAAVIVLRFFDVDLSFLMRGILFILLGGAFLFTNHLIIKKKGATHVK